ncbi:MAG TPA: diacylglycerol kinase family protein [Solirubrobacterales bacterium]|nr:diacylglycerol kinase family protein [Solirubrobacterales bacterium]
MRKYRQTRRAAAAGALVLPLLVLVLAAVIVVEQFPQGLIVLGGVAVALGAAWYGLLRSGAARVLGAGIALLALAAAVIVAIANGGHLVESLLIVAGLALALVAARSAFTVHVPLPAAPAPTRPVLFFNPKSGGGKAERFNLAEEARARGIEPVELTPGSDLEQLVRAAVARGADGLAMAGGDGSQAVVATVAAELDLPYACIPAGTRNHFALDLGVDRDDVVGALDAFVDGGERRVDLAEINGQVFVNNVSLGLYAEAVQQEGYREAKLRTILGTVPEALGPGGGGSHLRWTGSNGEERSSGAAILVSNNRYRLGRAIGSGTRPRIDEGKLGITVFSGRVERGQHRRPWQEWSAKEFEVDGDGPIAAGVDGEAMKFEPRLRFRIRPGVLRARIAESHPGASPSAGIPEGALEGVHALVRIAAGKNPKRA